MGKKKKKLGGNNQNRNQSRSPSSQSNSDRASQSNSDRAKNLADSSREAMNNEGLEAVPEPPMKNEVTELMAVTAVRAAEFARQNYEKLNEELLKRQNKLEKDLANLQEKENLAIELESTNKKERDAIASQSEELVKKQQELLKLQVQAEVGFISRREEIIGPLRDEIAQATANSFAKELEREAKLDESVKERRAVLNAESERLTEFENQIFSRERDLTKREFKVETIESNLKEDRDSFESNKDEHEKHVRADFEFELNDMRASISRLQDRNSFLELQQQKLVRLEKEISEDPFQLVKDRDDLQSKVDRLTIELSTRPSVDIKDKLDQAVIDRDIAIRDRDQNAKLLISLQSQHDFQSAKLEDYERLQVTKEALEQSVGAYKNEIQNFRDQLSQLQAERESQSAFPECSKMDRKFTKLQIPEGSPVVDLGAFVKELQVRMAYDKDAQDRGQKLNYRLEDIRIFLSGMAMSKLHLLEGVSGTGKTTFPNAFVNALGGDAMKIEVQAGWRDKQDLLGYYNSFERVYRETPCMQQLYKAGLSFWKDTVMFIVLDEINLSHPEQYFADFLSGLEDPKADKFISISDRGLPQLPENLSSKTGVQMRIPPNIWFIGTANQDETTYGFAPKTYDRAHVMELRPGADEVKSAPLPSRTSHVSLNSLEQAFSAAKSMHKDEVTLAKKFIEDKLREFFRDNFRVGWGHRLPLHMESFVPVNIAAGGSISEALDYIIATKVLKKIKGKHSIKEDKLQELRELIESSWGKIDDKNLPERTIKEIELEIAELKLG